MTLPDDDDRLSKELQSRSRSENRMERITFRIPQHRLKQIETLVERDVYQNRSQAIRDAIGELIPEQPTGNRAQDVTLSSDD